MAITPSRGEKGRIWASAYNLKTKSWKNRLLKELSAQQTAWEELGIVINFLIFVRWQNKGLPGSTASYVNKRRASDANLGGDILDDNAK